MNELSLSIDVENPGHFFACCGILYCADRIYDSAEGHFRTDSGQNVFVLTTTSESNPIEEIVSKLNASKDPRKVDPDKSDTALIFDSMSVMMDFWNHFDDRPKIKLFAGQEDSKKLLCRWMDHLARSDKKINGLLDLQVQDLPSGFDTTTSWNTLDIGFSLNAHKMNKKISTYPLVEFFAYLGIQTYSWEKRKDGYFYRIWTVPLPITLARAAAAGALTHHNKRCFKFNSEKSGQKGSV